MSSAVALFVAGSHVVSGAASVAAQNRWKMYPFPSAAGVAFGVVSVVVAATEAVVAEDMAIEVGFEVGEVDAALAETGAASEEAVGVVLVVMGDIEGEAAVSEEDATILAAVSGVVAGALDTVGAASVIMLQMGMDPHQEDSAASPVEGMVHRAVVGVGIVTSNEKSPVGMMTGNRSGHVIRPMVGLHLD